MYGRTAEERARTPDFCRMIDEGHFERVSGLLNQGLKAGANVEIGGTSDSAQRYIAPTVLSNVSLDSPLMHEEIFGPILPVLTYRSLAGALQTINARDKPLALYAFSKSDRVLKQILQSTPSGGTVRNDTLVQWAHPHLPVGGAGASGMGSYHGRFGFEAFSNRRSVVRQSKFSFVPLLAPPYTRTTRALLAVLEKLP